MKKASDTIDQPMFPAPSEEPLGIYVHVPFCKSRCAYCGFVTFPYRDELVDEYLSALAQEIRHKASALPRNRADKIPFFDTIYIGGGTPSVLPGTMLRELIDLCRTCFRVSDRAEVTVEANPGTVSRSALKDWQRAGVNRVSLGVQSLNARELTLMGRRHSAHDARASFRELRDAGFENISVDLIAGYPEQTVDSVLASLEGITELGPEHLSVYLLEVKHGTRLETEIREGLVKPVDDDIAADMYEEICRVSRSEGFEHYELSNFARNGKYSRHNLKYWQDREYVACGAGATGLVCGVRYTGFTDLHEYLRAIHEGAPAWVAEELSADERFGEALIMGLRLVAGADLDALTDRYGIDARSFVRQTVGDLIDAELCTLNGARLQLTPRGRLLSNMVFARWV
ncbi:MAG: radical SAM family heme chaperone HemW [Thermodesulfobacteriota bacterium]